MNIGEVYLDLVTNLALSGRIRLCVIGQDPYADYKACGIAFCTKTFDQLFHSSTCGKTVLESLGHGDSKKIQDNFNSPISFFFYLAAHYGIAFVNLADKTDELNWNLSYDHNKSVIEQGLIETRRLITNSNSAVLLGRSYQYEFWDAIGCDSIEATVHPSINARNSQGYYDYWSAGKKYLQSQYL